MLDTAPDGREPIGTPGPDRGAHKVHGFDPCLPKIKLQIEVEIWRIDANKNTRRLLQQTRLQLASDTHDFAVMPQDLDIATDGELVAGPPSLKAASSHLSTANAHGLQMGPTRLQAIQQ